MKTKDLTQKEAQKVASLLQELTKVLDYQITVKVELYKKGRARKVLDRIERILKNKNINNDFEDFLFSVDSAEDNTDLDLYGVQNELDEKVNEFTNDIKKDCKYYSKIKNIIK